MLLSGRKIFAQCPKKKQKLELFHDHIFPQNWSQGQLECMFSLPPQRTFFLKFRKELKLINFKKSNCSPKKLLWKKCSSHNSTASFLVSRQNNFGQGLERFTKLSFFQYKNFSLIMILRTGRIKFWQPCGKFFCLKADIFQLKVQTNRRIHEFS